MSFLEWAAKKSLAVTANDQLSSPGIPGLSPGVVTSPLTLNDWLHKKKDDFRPEKRIHDLLNKAEDLLEDDKYEDAAALISEAIAMAPNDYHLYTNRALCHDMLEDYDKCLTDAQTAISLSDKDVDRLVRNAKHPKDSIGAIDYAKYRNKLMYWRKARALVSKQRFPEAVEALVQSKALVIHCQFIDNEIRRIKVQVICDLGYDRPDVEEVCDRFNTIQEVVDHLKTNKKLMITDDSCDVLPSNPFYYHGLYVNGLAPDLEERQSVLEELMTSCGNLIRCKVYSNREQSRAIVAFDEEPESALAVRKAVRLIHSHKELIRDQSSDNLVIRYRHACIDGGTDLRADPQKNFKGLIIGGECYKWRTIGCEEVNCIGLHIPICHRLDQQSIETSDNVKKKRKPIVFDLDDTTPTTPSDPRLSRKIIKTESSAVTPIGRKSVHNRITFDVNESQDNETAEQSPIQTALVVSEKKVIRLKPSSHLSVNSEDTNSVNSQELVVKRPERKRIVFDLKDDDNDSRDSGKEGMTFTGIRPMVVTTVVPKTPTDGDRSVTSYDDLFD